MLSRDSKPEEVRAEWVRRLRSGEYIQGKGQLRVATAEGEERYCCLGILCEMAAEQGIVKSEPWVGGVHSDHNGTVYAYGDGQTSLATAALPPEVIVWAGFPHDGSLLPHGSPWEDPWDVAIKNDSGMSFSEIADFIEAQA